MQAKCSDSKTKQTADARCYNFLILTLFATGPASLEPSQVGQSLGNSFKLWPLGAL